MQTFTQGDFGHTKWFRNLVINMRNPVAITRKDSGYTSIIILVALALVGIMLEYRNAAISFSAIALGMSVFLAVPLLILAFDNQRSKSELAAANQKIAELSSKLEEMENELGRSKADLEQFAYLISHDLKAPVRNISSFMKLLANRYSAALPPDGREFVNMSLSGSERLAKQIDDMLSYYRVDRNLPPVTEVDLNETLRTVTMELHKKLSETNAAIVIDNGLPVLKEIHPNLLYQVFHQLIVNGIKFNANPNPEIKIDFEEAGDMIRFSVTDNGIGIDKEQESKLFRIFKRLHTNDKYEGNGVGLAICKKIVNSYQGDIWFDASTTGTGTSFYFTLPKNMVGPVMPKLTDFTPRQVVISKAA